MWLTSNRLTRASSGSSSLGSTRPRVEPGVHPPGRVQRPLQRQRQIPAPIPGSSAPAPRAVPRRRRAIAAAKSRLPDRLVNAPGLRPRSFVEKAAQLRGKRRDRARASPAALNSSSRSSRPTWLTGAGERGHVVDGGKQLIKLLALPLGTSCAPRTPTRTGPGRTRLSQRWCRTPSSGTPRAAHSTWSPLASYPAVEIAEVLLDLAQVTQQFTGRPRPPAHTARESRSRPSHSPVPERRASICSSTSARCRSSAARRTSGSVAAPAVICRSRSRTVSSLLAVPRNSRRLNRAGERDRGLHRRGRRIMWRHRC